MADYMMIGLEQDDGSYRMPLIVQLTDGALDEELRRTIRETTAENAGGSV